MQTKGLTLDQYLAEVIHMLERQPCDWHVGARERIIIRSCHTQGRPVSNAVSYIMRIYQPHA